jgi:hexosaminidase
MADFGLVPEPRRVEALGGSLDLRGGGLLRCPGELTPQGRLGASWLTEALALRGAAGSFSVSSLIEGASPPAVPDAGGPVLELRLDGALPPEDYVLTVREGAIEARSGGREGAAHALSTLRQLVLSEGPVLPALRIEDGPRFPWRGAMLDCCRNFFRVEFVERFIDLMALHKLNRFHWHLTDDQAWRLEIAAHPEIAELGSKRQDRRYGEERIKAGSYSRADVRRIVTYAEARGIIVVPEIETPGHAIALLSSHPELSCRGYAASGHAASGHAAGGGAFRPEDRYGIFEDVLCAGEEGSFELLGEIFDEVASLFPGPWVHAGGDEVPKARWSECPRCRARMEAEGLRDGEGRPDPELLQLWFMNRVAGMLAGRGKRMIGWDEILGKGEGRASRGSALREDAIVMSWRGVEGGLRAARGGYDAIMAPQTKACYLDHKHLDLPEEPGNLGVCTVEDSYRFEPLSPELSASEGARILGGQANLWTEFMYFGRNVEYMAFPRLCALSEVFWSPREKRDFGSFERRMSIHGARLDALGVNRYRGRFRAL